MFSGKQTLAVPPAALALRQQQRKQRAKRALCWALFLFWCS